MARASFVRAIFLTGPRSAPSFLSRGGPPGKEIAMPYVIHKGDKEQQQQKPASQGASAGQKKTKGASSTPSHVSPKIMITIAVVAILFAAFMYRAYLAP